MTEVYDFFMDEYPNEGCGLIMKNKEGDRKFIPSKNMAENPKDTFVLDKHVFFTAMIDPDWEVEWVVHSHTDQEDFKFSESDTKISEFLNLDYMVMEVPSGEVLKWENE